MMESQAIMNVELGNGEGKSISSQQERLSSSSTSSSSSISSTEFVDPLSEIGSNTLKNITFEQGSQRRNSDPTLQSPTVQKMERSSESSGYRIPSHVFSREKSGNQHEWSVTSNESLFSINVGNMSFTHDQFNWLAKADEFEQVQKPDTNAPEKSLNNVNDHTKNNAHIEDDQMSSHLPFSPSESSGQSFAFPLLAGETQGGAGNPRLNSLKEDEKKSTSIKEGNATLNKQGSKPEKEDVDNSTCSCSCSWFSNCFSCYWGRSKPKKEATGSTN